MIRSFSIAVAVLLSATMVRAEAGARTDSIVPLGVCLENYNYPYPVKYITLDIQHQALKMAYMDVQPLHPNGHTITQAKIPNCRLVELPGVGHVPHVEDFDQFIQAVSGFLNG